MLSLLGLNSRYFLAKYVNILQIVISSMRCVFYTFMKSYTTFTGDSAEPCDIGYVDKSSCYLLKVNAITAIISGFG